MKATASTLKVGEYYAHKNGTFIRRIHFLDKNMVAYKDGYTPGYFECSRQHFVRVCPRVATPEDIKREKEFNESIPEEYRATYPK